jgi:hypothetical protein
MGMPQVQTLLVIVVTNVLSTRSCRKKYEHENRSGQYKTQQSVDEKQSIHHKVTHPQLVRELPHRLGRPRQRAVVALRSSSRSVSSVSSVTAGDLYSIAGDRNTNYRSRSGTDYAQM